MKRFVNIYEDGGGRFISGEDYDTYDEAIASRDEVSTYIETVQIIGKCPNCKEDEDDNCACMRNRCVVCGDSVGNITFSVCDKCWDKK